jgi:preprotein translocase subunit YajC
MNFLISDAWAQAPAGAPEGSPFVTLIMLGVMFVAFYFLLIRPQAKRAKEHKAMVAALAKGDEVVTMGGVLGRVTKIDENYVALEVAEGVELKVQRQAVQSVLPKGTLKSVAG